jgi:hypothetical protein
MHIQENSFVAMRNFIAQPTEQNMNALQNISLDEKVSDGLFDRNAFIELSNKTIEVLQQYKNSRWILHDESRLKLAIDQALHTTWFAGTKVEELTAVVPQVTAPRQAPRAPAQVRQAPRAPAQNQLPTFAAKGAFQKFAFERADNGKLYFFAQFTKESEVARKALAECGLKMKANGSTKMATGIFHTKDKVRQQKLLQVAVNVGAINASQKKQAEAIINRG